MASSFEYLLDGPKGHVLGNLECSLPLGYFHYSHDVFTVFAVLGAFWGFFWGYRGGRARKMLF